MSHWAWDNKKAVGGNEWVHPGTGEHRLYVDWETLAGFSIERYNKGGVRSIYLKGEKLANREGNEINGSKVWLDEDGGVHARSSDRLNANWLIGLVEEAIAKLEAEATAA